MKTPIKILIVVALAIAAAGAVALKQGKGSSESNEPASTVTSAKLPKLVDLGADKCIPCKMMAPILEGLEKEYAGKMDVKFIDVWKNPDAGKQYGLDVIPTPLDYDAALPAWLWARDVFSGEDAIKAAGLKYLPRLADQSQADYDAYRT